MRVGRFRGRYGVECHGCGVIEAMNSCTRGLFGFQRTVAGSVHCAAELAGATQADDLTMVSVAGTA